MGKSGPSSSSSPANKGGGKSDGKGGGAATPGGASEGPKKRPPKGHKQKGAGAVIADKGCGGGLLGLGGGSKERADSFIITHWTIQYSHPLLLNPPKYPRPH